MLQLDLFSICCVHVFPIPFVTIGSYGWEFQYCFGFVHLYNVQLYVHGPYEFIRTLTSVRSCEQPNKKSCSIEIMKYSHPLPICLFQSLTAESAVALAWDVTATPSVLQSPRLPSWPFSCFCIISISAFEVDFCFDLHIKHCLPIWGDETRKREKLLSWGESGRFWSYLTWTFFFAAGSQHWVWGPNAGSPQQSK